MSAIEKAITVAGGLSALAERLHAKPQAVNNWRKRGVPAERVLEIERAVNGEVSRHQLRPDLYPLEPVS